MAVINKQMKTFNVPAGSDVKRYEIVDDAGRKMIAPDWYSVSDQAFVVGEHVGKDGILYVFTAPHSAGSAWNASQVTPATMAGEIADVKATLGAVPSGKTAQGQITENADEISALKQALGGIGLGIEDGALVIDPVTE